MDIESEKVHGFWFEKCVVIVWKRGENASGRLAIKNLQSMMGLEVIVSWKISPSL